MFALLERGLRGVLVGLLAVMTCIVSYQIVSRYLFETPLAWGEEITRYLFIYSIFLGAAVGVRYQVHVSIDALLRRLPEKWRRPANGLSLSIVAVFLLFLVVFGFRLALFNMSQASPALGIPIGLAYLAMPIGGLISLIFLFGPKRAAEIRGEA